MKQFKKLKKKLLKRLSSDSYSFQQFSKTTNSEELLNAVKNQFVYYCSIKLIDSDLIKKYKDLFNSEKIYANINVTDGFLLVDGDSKVSSWGNSIVYAYENSTVYAYENSIVYAYENSIVHANGTSIVYAYENSIVHAYENSTVIYFRK